MKLITGVAQYDVPESVEGSLDKLREVVINARKKGVQLLVAPETAIGMLADIRKN